MDNPSRSINPPINPLLVRSLLVFKPTYLTYGLAIALMILTIYFSLNIFLFIGILFVGNLVILSASNYVSLAAAFLEECAPRPIPKQKFAQSLTVLKQEGERLQFFGFQTIDRHYIKRTYDVLRMLMQHKETPIYWNFIHFVGRLTYSELFTQFDSGLILSTASVSAGHLPKPDQFYIQSLVGASYEQLLEAHQDAIEIFAEYGHRPVLLPPDAREYGTRLEQMITAHVMAQPFWALRMTFWILLKAGRKYSVPIREQLAVGTIAIP